MNKVTKVNPPEEMFYSYTKLLQKMTWEWRVCCKKILMYPHTPPRPRLGWRSRVKKVEIKREIQKTKKTLVAIKQPDLIYPLQPACRA